jgi:flagellar basal-body rod protein FlgB
LTTSIEAITTAALARAMDVAMLRHQAIAANIANQAVEGYVPMKVSFAAEFAQARMGQTATRLDEQALSAMKPEMAPALDARGAPAKVRLDSEMVNMAQNAGQFQALARGLSRHFSILESAANDGKK